MAIRGVWSFRQCLADVPVRTTLIYFIENAKAGMTHAELESLLHISVHHTLHDLTRKNSISRKRIEKFYLYISCDAEHASSQVASRQEKITDEQDRYPLNPFQTIEVLVDLLHSEDWRLKSIVNRLKARNIKVTEHQIDEVFSRYSIKKKIST